MSQCALRLKALYVITNSKKTTSWLFLNKELSSKNCICSDCEHCSDRINFARSEYPAVMLKPAAPRCKIYSCSPRAKCIKDRCPLLPKSASFRFYQYLPANRPTNIKLYPPLPHWIGNIKPQVSESVWTYAPSDAFLFSWVKGITAATEWPIKLSSSDGRSPLLLQV